MLSGKVAAIGGLWVSGTVGLDRQEYQQQKSEEQCGIMHEETWMDISVFGIALILFSIWTTDWSINRH